MTDDNVAAFGLLLSCRFCLFKRSVCFCFRSGLLARKALMKDRLVIVNCNILLPV